MSVDWPYQKITDHQHQAIDRLTSEYNQATKFRSVVGTFGGRAQIVEDAIWTLLTKRWVSTAEGVQLDKLGEIVGVSRRGRTDDEYRKVIYLQIRINNSGGQPEIIIELLNLITDADYSIYGLIPDAKFWIFTNGDMTLFEAERMKRLIPAGVGPTFFRTSNTLLPLGTVELQNQKNPYNYGGFAELGGWVMELKDSSGNRFVLELKDSSNNSTVMEIIDRNDPVVLTESGVLPEDFKI